MKLDDMPAVIAVQERDVDLLILEELHASPFFVSWWCERLNLTDAVFDGAWHSISNADGETDVLLRVRIADQRVGVLIENKVAASEQHEQDLRYHRRGAQGIADGWFERYVTCMCAPQAYLNGLAEHSQYAGRISYEQIAEWFAQQDDTHSAWRKRLMDEAVRQGRRGYMKVVNEAVTVFHQEYYVHLCRTQPTLRMNRPGERGGQGYWIILWVEGWPKHVRLNHKMKRNGQGTVELGLMGFTQSDIAARVGELPEDVLPITTGHYGSLAIRVPPLDYKMPLAPQLAALDEAFAAMLRLTVYAKIFI
jgi:PD-(D/E)XK nuclease superfamily